MTHDLLKNLVIECGLNASSVIITDLLDNTFFASIEFTDENGDPMLLDSRPSDAIALALRLDCPIYVRQKVLDLGAAKQPESESRETILVRRRMTGPN